MAYKDRDKEREAARLRQRLHRERKRMGIVLEPRPLPLYPKSNPAKKLAVLIHYGNDRCACVRCGESRPACLSIDHVNGGGTSHRREFKLRSSDKFYRWLIVNNYPEGYQTLCMNCQFVKRFERNEHN